MVKQVNLNNQNFWAPGSFSMPQEAYEKLSELEREHAKEIKRLKLDRFKSLHHDIRKVVLERTLATAIDCAINDINCLDAPMTREHAELQDALRYNGQERIDLCHSEPLPKTLTIDDISYDELARAHLDADIEEELTVKDKPNR